MKLKKLRKYFLKEKSKYFAFVKFVYGTSPNKSVEIIVAQVQFMGEGNPFIVLREPLDLTDLMWLIFGPLIFRIFIDCGSST